MWLLGVGAAIACERWAPPTQLVLSAEHPDLVEASGLAVSSLFENTYWTHDDAGGSVLFRFGLDTSITAHEIAGARNDDWEDIASAACADGDACLYVGDIGLRAAAPDDRDVEIYVVREPRGDGPAVLVETWRLEWPDTPFDAEALLVHPCTREAWIVTKPESDSPPTVFRVPDRRGPNRRHALIPVATLDGIGAPNVGYEKITSGSFSPDGRALVLRSNDTIWRLAFDPAEPWSATPQIVGRLERSLAEKGEGIAWDRDGDLIVVGERALGEDVPQDIVWAEVGELQPMPVGRLVCRDEEVPEVCEAPRTACATTGPGAAGWGWLALAWLRRRRAGAAGF